MPTEQMIMDELTKDMSSPGPWEWLYATSEWGPQSRPELPEDYVEFSLKSGVVKRMRVGEGPS